MTKPPTKTALKIKEAIELIPVIRETEGFVSPTRYAANDEPEDDTSVEFIDEAVPVLILEPTPEITRDEFEKMKEVLADMAIKEPEKVGMDMRPGKEKMMPLSGGLYLPVRRRVAWMRGEPVPRPTWGIVNTLLKYEMGTLEAPRGGGPGGKMAKISGGYAVVKSEIIDDSGRIISTGYAQERSEIFPDFIEKAETAAVGRAAALAGFGTEAALDLDEGLDQENVVDAPVRPITITSGDVRDSIKVGGRVSGITNAQLKEIGRMVKEEGLGPDRVAGLITTVTGEVIPSDVLENDESANSYIIAILRKMTNEQAGKMIGALMSIRDTE
jgi:hypothetical protein